MVNIVAIAFGAAVGANLRYGISTWANRRFGMSFPYGTLLINVLGCLLIGILFTLAANHLRLSEPLRLLLVTGLLGGFTTFSSFGYESYALFVTGDWMAAGMYIGSSVVIGLLAVFLGVGMVQWLLG